MVSLDGDFVDEPAQDLVDLVRVFVWVFQLGFNVFRLVEEVFKGCVSDRMTIFQFFYTLLDGGFFVF